MAKAKLKMEIPKDILRTYQFYTENGKRLAIFAVPDYVENSKDGVLSIFMIECSEKDSFDKKLANIAFSIYLGAAPVAKKLLNVQIKWKTDLHFEAGHSKREFLKWCRRNYCVMENRLATVEIPVLVKRIQKDISVPVKVYSNRAKYITKI